MKDLYLRHDLHAHLRQLLKVEALVLPLVLQALLDVHHFKDVSARVRHQDLPKTVRQLGR